MVPFRRVSGLLCRCLRASGKSREQRRGTGTVSRHEGVSALHGIEAGPPVSLPPCVGRVVNVSRNQECLVFGVVHTPSARQQSELRRFISDVAPDVVLLELDQQRLNTLLESGPSIFYGAELATAASVAWESGSIVLLGDVRTRDSFAALLKTGQLIDPVRLRAGARLALKSLFSDRPPLRKVWQNVDVLAALSDDLSKLAPMVIALALSAGVLAATSSSWHQQQGSPWELATSLAVASIELAALLRVFDVFLLARDEALAASAIRALDIASGLRSGRLLRRSWTFHSDPISLASARAARPTPVNTTPFFILRRPLEKGERRRLNLFEPRWLALMDELAGSASKGSLVGASFGTIAALNHICSPSEASSPSVSEDSEPCMSSERLADIVLEPVARLARVMDVQEGVRPVTRARLLTLWIEGEDLVHIEPASLQAYGGGFLAGKVLDPVAEEHSDDCAGFSTQSADEQQTVRVVCVVGLAHANGVIDRCAEQLQAQLRP